MCLVRLAIISDIHSNLEALTCALQVIDDEGVDEIVCLGDVVGYGANPNECLTMVRARCSTILLGNHDAAATDLAFRWCVHPGHSTQRAGSSVCR